MVKRPPKRWMKRCISGVEKSGYADDPGAVCGSLWHHKMTVTQKRMAVRESEKRKKRK